MRFRNAPVADWGRTASGPAIAAALLAATAVPVRAQDAPAPSDGPPAQTSTEAGSGGTTEAPQTAPAAPNAGDAAPDGPIRDIVVTAQRRESLLQETPIAITAVTAETFEDLGARRIEDLARFAPSLFVPQSTFGGANGPSIRGIGSFNLVSSASFPVAFYFDGLFQDRPYGNNLRQFDLDRIEVLRGPQGVLFGRNATAGAINVLYALPTEQLSARVLLAGGSFDTFESQVSIRGPVADGIKLGIAAGAASSEGWGRNVFNGRRTQGFEAENLRGTAVFDDPSDRLRVILRGLYTRELNEFGLKQAFADAAGRTITADNLRVALRTPVLGVNEFANNLPSFFEVERFLASAEVTYKADAFDAVLLVGHTDTANLSDSDTDGGDNRNVLRPTSIFNNTVNNYDSQQVELRFSSTGLQGVELDAGFFYITEFNDDRGSSLRFVNAAGVRLNDARALISDTRTNSYAGFAHGKVAITKRLSGRAGVRYTYETKVSRSQQFNNITNRPTPFVRGELDFDNWTPSFGLDYEFSDLTFGYATVSKGFKSGGFSTDPNSGQLFDYRPEEVWNYELGLKTDLFDRRLRLNTAAFYLDYTDLQLAQNLPAGGAVVNNAASARIWGVEVESVLRPVDNFTITGAVSYLNAELKDYLYITRAPTFNLRGERLERAPEWKAAVVAEYVVPTAYGSLALQGNYSYESEVAFQTVPDSPVALVGPPASPPFERSRLYTRRAIHLLGARVELTLPGDRVSIALFGDNLTNTRFFGALSRLGGGTSTVGTVNAPRSFRVELSAKY